MGEIFMKDERLTCTAYVDYENLVDTLSYHHSLDIVTLLNQVLERARQQFRIQRILIFGNWTLYPMPTRIDARGVVRCACNDPGTDASLEIEESIIQGLASKESSEMYLLISGQARYFQALKRLRQAQKSCVLWTLVPLSAQEQTWSSAHETLRLPPTLVRPKWTRQILLQALALETARASAPEGEPLTLPTLREILQQRPALEAWADNLLSLALRERILLLQEVSDPLQEPLVSLNKRHELSQQAWLIQEHILNTVSILQQSRGWVAFSTLEKALSTYNLLAKSQQLRQHWIEMLVEHGDLQSKLRTRPGSQLTTTTIRLNPSSTQDAIAQQQAHNLSTLICVADICAYRRDQTWISATRLQRYLTLHMTYAEARATLMQAIEDEVVRSETRTGKRNPARSTTVAWINHEHPLVQEKLARRDRLLLTAYTHLAQRDFRSSESLLLEEWSATEQIAEAEARDWLRLLSLEGIVRKLPFEAQMNTGEHIVYLIQDDPLIHALLENQERQWMEVQE
jgi:hypothetical protein